jgi:hypothetical protein
LIGLPAWRHQALGSEDYEADGEYSASWPAFVKLASGDCNDANADLNGDLTGKARSVPLRVERYAPRTAPLHPHHQIL